MGARRTLASSSSLEGGGRIESPHTATASSGKKSAPVAAGIQNGLTCQTSISSLPTDFTAPEETIKLAHTIAPRTSDVLRPSMKPKTNPQIRPSGSPLRNIAATFQGAGRIANSNNASHESAISLKISPARLLGLISAISLTPINLEAA